MIPVPAYGLGMPPRPYVTSGLGLLNFIAPLSGEMLLIEDADALSMLAIYRRKHYPSLRAGGGGRYGLRGKGRKVGLIGRGKLPI